MADRNPASNVTAIPGVLGWNRAGKRIHVRMHNGKTFTVRDLGPDGIRNEAANLRARAKVLMALADDLETA